MTAPGREQRLMAQVADWHFTRVGLYPQNNFVHVDLMPRIYWERYGLAKYWVRISGKYHHFDTLEEAIEFAKPFIVGAGDYLTINRWAGKGPDSRPR